MKQEDKELLIKDLSARLLCKVKIKVRSNDIRTVRAVDIVEGIVHFVESDSISPFGVHIEHPMTFRQLVKPYLRPMSSMTEEESDEFQQLDTECDKMPTFDYVSIEHYRIFDWLNKKMFDYRGLIPLGLALKAPEEMYVEK